MRAIACAWSLLAGGCGFLGEDRFGERRLPDIAPFEDLGPLTVCDGSARLGVFALGPAGACATADHSCSSDGACASRKRCVCGRCLVAVCDGNDECGEGRVCSFGERRCDRPCADDTVCARGERCLPGLHVCRGLCASDADCQSGERCPSSRGLCVVDVCASDGDCPAGRSCALERTPALLAHPAPLLDQETTVLYFERSDATGAASIYRATSRDGRSFVIDPRSALAAGHAPTVVRRAAHDYVLVFERGGDLLRATSSDGIAFGAQAAPIVSGATAPALLGSEGGGEVVYYATGGGLARAVGQDGRFAPGALVLTPEGAADPATWPLDQVAAPFAERVLTPDGRSWIRLWFAGHGPEDGPSMQFGQPMPTPPNWSIGEAISADGIQFTAFPYNPVFARVLDFLTHPSELDPAVLHVRDEWFLYYRRAAADGTAPGNLAVARSAVAPR